MYSAFALAQVAGSPAQPQVRETRVVGNPYVFVQNPLYAPVTFEFEVHRSNLYLSRGERFVQVFPPRSLTLAFWATPDQKELPWAFSYSWHYIMGDVNAVPDGASYDLPFAPGQGFRVNQGYGGVFSHTGVLEFSLDFALPEGTPVYAAREGVVVAVESRNRVGRADPSLMPLANFITVLHPDGTFGHYAHLRYAGCAVKVGQYVERGQLIGYSGNTGFTSGPHLHFHVYRATSAEGGWATLPTAFNTTAGPAQLAQGGVYFHPQNQGLEQAGVR